MLHPHQFFSHCTSTFRFLLSSSLLPLTFPVPVKPHQVIQLEARGHRLELKEHDSAEQTKHSLFRA